MKIVTVRDSLRGAPSGSDPSRPSTWWPAEILRRTNGATQAPGWTWGMPDAMLLDGQAVVAQVNHGRWVADCPSCLIAQIVDPADPQLWCPVCQPAGWRSIVFPSEREAIEALLEERDDPISRNWGPWETVGMLAAENAAGGPVDHLIETDALVHCIAPGTVLHPDSELAG